MWVCLICGLRYSEDSSGASVKSEIVCVSHPIPREINITFRKTLIFSGNIKRKYNISVKVTVNVGFKLKNNC